MTSQYVVDLTGFFLLYNNVKCQPLEMEDFLMTVYLLIMSVSFSVHYDGDSLS